MQEPATLTVAIISLVIIYTGSVVSLVLWLSNKFRSLEAALYREINKIRSDYEGRLQRLHDRVYRLELYEVGWTKVDLKEEDRP